MSGAPGWGLSSIILVKQVNVRRHVENTSATKSASVYTSSSVLRIVEHQEFSLLVHRDSRFRPQRHLSAVANRPHDGADELARASTECDEGLLT